jgi:acyl-CoA synthetase (AMP-forming)/AMP-acid ligase II
MGIAFPGVDVGIFDPVEDAPVADGVEGEIWVRGPNVSPGYVRDAHLGLVRGGADGSWLRTGDLGVRDAEGSVTFRGLRKPMFTRNGFNIYPAELTRVVGAMPGVARVAVRAVPDPVKEFEIALDVVAPGGDVTPDAVKAWCAERLSAYKQPSEVHVLAG